MGPNTFGKSERLLKRPDFEKVMAQGRKKRVASLCTVFLCPNGMEGRRLGIIASRKVGNAVVRNRAKRKIREIFRRIKGRLRPGLDIVIISGRDLAPLPCSILEEKLSEALLS